MEQTTMHIQVRQLLEEVIEKYENAQLLLLEYIGSESATSRERRMLAEDVARLRARYEQLLAEEREEREAA